MITHLFFMLNNWQACIYKKDLPGGSAGNKIRRHKRCTLSLRVRKILWKRKWQPTPVFLPEKSHGQRSQVGYNPKGGKGFDTTEQLSTCRKN